MRRLFVLLSLGLLVALGAATTPSASSHREAPLISQDPLADNTDTYAFVSPASPDKVVLIANYIPLEAPYGGPNFFKFDDNVLYEIMVDNNGDAVEDLTYQLRFTTTTMNPNTFLYNTGPITSLDDPDFNVRQHYSVTEVRGPRRTGTATRARREPGVAAGQRRHALHAQLRGAGRSAHHRKRRHAGVCGPARRPVLRRSRRHVRPAGHPRAGRQLEQPRRQPEGIQRPQHRARDSDRAAVALGHGAVEPERPGGDHRRLGHGQPPLDDHARRREARATAVRGCRCRAWASRW